MYDLIGILLFIGYISYLANDSWESEQEDRRNAIRDVLNERK